MTSVLIFRDQLQVRLFSVGFLDFEDGQWKTQNVKDTFWRFYMNDRDSAFISIEEKKFHFRAGRLYFVPADVAFGCSSGAPFKHFYIHFDVGGLTSLMKQELFSAPIELAQNAILEKESRTLSKIVAKGTDASTPSLALQLRLQSLIASSFAHHFQMMSTQLTQMMGRLSQQQETVAPSLEYIEKNLAKPLTNALLARLCFLSEDHFARRFREIMGETPGHYIRRRRIAIAAQELLFTKLSIEEIALRAGFCNRFYFSRVFAEEMGAPPAAYRKMTRP